MSPDERSLLEEVIKLSEENNKILRKMQKAAKLAVIWGFIKVLIIVVPIVAGLIYLQPFFREVLDNFQLIQDIVNSANLVLPR